MSFVAEGPAMQQWHLEDSSAFDRELAVLGFQVSWSRGRDLRRVICAVKRYAAITLAELLRGEERPQTAVRSLRQLTAFGERYGLPELSDAARRAIRFLTLEDTNLAQAAPVLGDVMLAWSRLEYEPFDDVSWTSSIGSPRMAEKPNRS